MLRRKPRKRYLSVLHRGSDAAAIDTISKRVAELFGQIALEKAALRHMRTYDDIVIVRCRLAGVHAVLVSIALADPPMVTMDMSGSISRLKKRGRRFA